MYQIRRLSVRPKKAVGTASPRAYAAAQHLPVQFSCVSLRLNAERSTKLRPGNFV